MVLSSLIGLALSGSAVAKELVPLQAGTFVLGDHTASVHYTVQEEGFEVVVTIAPDAGQPAPSRCTMHLAPGQISTVSVGSLGTDAPPTVLKFERDGDTLRAEIASDEG